jgi:hypothetical protein
MRFWIKLACIGIFGYVTFCLMALRADYCELAQSESEFQLTANVVIAQCNASGIYSAQARDCFDHAFEDQATA